MYVNAIVRADMLNEPPPDEDDWNSLDAAYAQVRVFGTKTAGDLAQEATTEMHHWAGASRMLDRTAIEAFERGS